MLKITVEYISKRAKKCLIVYHYILSLYLGTNFLVILRKICNSVPNINIHPSNCNILIIIHPFDVFLILFWIHEPCRVKDSLSGYLILPSGQWVLEPDGPVDTHPSRVCPAAAACWLLVLIDMAQGHLVPSLDFLDIEDQYPKSHGFDLWSGLMTYPKASHVAVVAVAVSHQRGYSAIHTPGLN